MLAQRSGTRPPGRRADSGVDEVVTGLVDGLSDLVVAEPVTVDGDLPGGQINVDAAHPGDLADLAAHRAHAVRARHAGNRVHLLRHGRRLPSNLPVDTQRG